MFKSSEAQHESTRAYPQGPKAPPLSKREYLLNQIEDSRQRSPLSAGSCMRERCLQSATMIKFLPLDSLGVLHRIL